MYQSVQEALNKWGGSLTVIDKWLNYRQRLIVNYCKLASIAPFDTSSALPQQKDITFFCQELLDYISAAHFDVYEKIIADTELQEKSIKLLAQLYPKFITSTDLALNFNDNYAVHLSTRNSGAFDRDLSALGQALFERFEYEDKLIKVLYENFQEKDISV